MLNRKNIKENNSVNDIQIMLKRTDLSQEDREFLEERITIMKKDNEEFATKLLQNKYFRLAVTLNINSRKVNNNRDDVQRKRSKPEVFDDMKMILDKEKRIQLETRNANIR
jgi:CRISPR/Cas system type I-B associated protein Csh2 (Cas7 group RAMP superfamily)